ncbi:MAG: MerR family transcriptional regulator [Bilophila sp.]
MAVIVYAPTILRSMEEIKKAFGVGDKQIRAWVEQGAPIAVEGEGKKVRYSAELVRLQLWREERHVGRMSSLIGLPTAVA